MSAATPDPAAGKPLYATVEDWVCDYFLLTFPRPVGQVGMVRWRWCQQWWRHDEAVTRLTALWYAWENARAGGSPMLGWLREVDHHLPILYGEDGPFRDCTPGRGDELARHTACDPVPTQPAPVHWWRWWATDATAG